MLIRVFLCCLAALSLNAGTISLTGQLDPNNSDDVFLYSFNVPAPGSPAPIDLQFQSYGYGGGTDAVGIAIPAGGFDSYLSVFSGTGANATFLASNDDGLCPPGNFAPACADPTLSLTNVSPGWYTLALTAFDNISFAENDGSGTLGDGFVGFGDYFDSASNEFRTSNFALDVSSTSGFVPEPGSFVLFAAGAALLALGRFLILFRRKVSC